MDSPIDRPTHQPSHQPYIGKTEAERRHEFAEYLRNRQRASKYLKAEVIDAITDDNIIKSYRFCCKCKEPFYTEVEERQAILEFDCPQSTYDAIGEMMDAREHC